MKSQTPCRAQGGQKSPKGHHSDPAPVLKDQPVGDTKGARAVDDNVVHMGKQTASPALKQSKGQVPLERLSTNVPATDGNLRRPSEKTSRMGASSLQQKEKDAALALELLKLLEEKPTPEQEKKAPEPPAAKRPESKRSQLKLEIGETIRNRWKVIKRLGGGGFGDIYEAHDMAEDRSVAIKIEAQNDPKQVLKMEVTVLRKMQGRLNTCRFYGCGRTDSYNFLVMSLCGRNLSELRREAPWGYFSQSTAIRLVIQTINAVKDLHDVGFLHRDVKPSNFAMGSSEEDKRTVFLLDFGLARQYVGPEGHHRSPRSAAGFRGTIRYASLTPHRNKEMSRIDDIWSLFYMLIEFLRGSLPWRKLREREQVKRMKERIGGEALIKDSPEELKDFLESIENTGYYDEPDYAFLSETLQKIIEPQNIRMDDPFDWEMGYKNCYVPPKQWSLERLNKSDHRKAAGASSPDISPILYRIKPQSPLVLHRLTITSPSKKRKAKSRAVTSPSNSPFIFKTLCRKY